MFEFLKKKPAELEEPVCIAKSGSSTLWLDTSLHMVCGCGFACMAAYEGCTFNGTSVKADTGESVEFDGYNPNDKWWKVDPPIENGSRQLHFPLSEIIVVTRSESGGNEYTTQIEQTGKRLFVATPDEQLPKYIAQ